MRWTESQCPSESDAEHTTTKQPLCSKNDSIMSPVGTTRVGPRSSTNPSLHVGRRAILRADGISPIMEGCSFALKMHQHSTFVAHRSPPGEDSRRFPTVDRVLWGPLEERSFALQKFVGSCGIARFKLRGTRALFLLMTTLRVQPPNRQNPSLVAPVVGNVSSS